MPVEIPNPKDEQEEEEEEEEEEEAACVARGRSFESFRNIFFLFFWRKKEKRDNTWVRYIWSSVIIVLEWKCMCRIDISCRYCVAIVVYIISFDCIYT